MKKCKNPTCEKELIGTSESRKFCDNNNKCKNDYHNGLRSKKVELADGLIATLTLQEHYKVILDKILGENETHVLSQRHLELMGVDLDSPIFEPYTVIYDFFELHIEFDQYLILAFVGDERVYLSRLKF